MDTIKEIIEKKSNVYYIGGVRYEIAPQVQQCIDISEKKLASLRATNIRLKAENERMRDALKSIVLDGIDMPAPQRREELINRMVDTANAALESEAPND